MTRKTDRDKPIYVGIFRMLNLPLNTTRAMFIPKIMHVVFVVDEVAVGQV